MINPADLTNRTYVISGAASGIGRATAILLSQQGASLALLDINIEGLKETRQMCVNRDKVQIYELDLMNVDAYKDCFSLILNEMGKVNGMVHCAGIPYISPLKMVSADHSEKVYKLNTYAGIELAKYCTQHKMYAGEKGSIVFISSVYGLVGSAANVGYAMSKGAIVAITKSLAMELAPKGIRVNCVAPGFIKTSMAEQVDSKMDGDYNQRLDALHPLGLGQPDDIANAILYLLSDMSKWVTGSVLNVDGGFTAQ